MADPVLDRENRAGDDKAHPLLEVKDLEAGYGQIQVLWGVSLTLREGEITCIVGSNGAGKSTLLRAISGVVTKFAGSVFLNGRDLSKAAPAEVLSAGIAHVPEGRRLFRGLPVRDNLILGAYLRNLSRADLDDALDFVYGLFPILKARRAQDATTLSGGEQQMCAIARGLMAKPKLLMIDELSLGLAPRAVENLTEALVSIRNTGVTILVVEQDVLTAFELARYGVVVETGRVALAGATAELMHEPRIRQAYLGI
jgi:branched-chain amino acid transport system ATP-binding protein